MFIIALGLGIFSYYIFLLGLLGLLYPPVLTISSAIFVLVVAFALFSKLNIDELANLLKDRWVLCILILLLLQGVVNLVGALGPELAFDALWYHLTLPKLYLLHHVIFHIPGGLLYYSDMPKLGEMLYIPAISVGSEILAKLLHFGIGVATVIVLYRLSRLFFSPMYAILACLLYYSNLVVDWESTTAYIDLFRTFYEVLAFYYFYLWTKNQKLSSLLYSSILLGFVITSKLIAMGSLLIYIPLVFYFSNSTKTIEKGKRVFLYVFISLLVPLPWFIFSFFHTGNPVYPLFTNLYPTNVSLTLFNPVTFIMSVWTLFTHTADPVSPLYIMCLPLLFNKKVWKNKILILFSGLSILIWYFTPQTGGGRFILPYLPILSLTTVIMIKDSFNNSKRISIAAIVVVSCISILYRGVTNAKFVPVILGQETKSQFLTTHLNFSFGDFYDTDNYFSENIRATDRVLLYGFHNLYYVDFPFIDETWVKKGDTFNYVAVQNTDLPRRFNYLKKVYSNPITHVTVYTTPNKIRIRY